MGAISFSLDQGLLDELLRLMPLEQFIESGTFQGETLAKARKKFRRCLSIELSEKYHAAAQTRFAGDPAVELLLGDSPVVIKQLRPRFADAPTLFWLDAHWCAAENTAGERSQCPLLAELAAIGTLNLRSVVLIDDARLFLSPPPQPHEISDWPDLDSVLHALRRLSRKHSVVCFNDVILFVPHPILLKLRPYIHSHGIDLLSYSDKARDYDSLLDQTRGKEKELQTVQAALRQVTASAQERERDLIRSSAEAENLRVELLAKQTDQLAAHAEADRLRASAADLTLSLLEKEKSLQAALEENQRIMAVARERESALAASNAEAENLRAELLAKQADQLAAHAEADRLRASAADLTLSLLEKEKHLLATHAEADRLRASAADLTLSLLEKGKSLRAALQENQRIMAIVGERESALAASNAEAENLRAESLAKQTDLLAAHAEADRLRASAADLTLSLQEKEKSLQAALEENQRIMAIARERESALAASSTEAEGLRTDTAVLNDQLGKKESVIQDLARICAERLKLIKELTFTGERPLANTAKVVSYRMQGPLRRLLRTLRIRYQTLLNQNTTYPIGKLVQYAPRTLELERFPACRPPRQWPRICIITPSFNQARFLPRTIHSVLDQEYPNLAYGVQDGGSTDGSAHIITDRIGQLMHAESAPDDGQADAIQKGFRKLYPGREDIMAWLNSDDVLMPGTLAYIGQYFARHPEVDVIYGHRVIIDENDQEVGRWFMPRYHIDTLRWFDLVPQETLFWRARCFEEIGGLDPSFHFAMDWDLLLRFEQAGFHIRRLPYFLGCFRVHTAQKTSTRIQTLGEEEMTRLRRRTHALDVPHWEIHRQLDAEVGRSALVAWLHQFGLRC